MLKRIINFAFEGLDLVEGIDSQFVSIIVCTYNRKNFLKDCLNSILKMDFPKTQYEILIIDGGSNDGTDVMCREMPGVRFVIEGRFGLAHARNRGADLAKGNIVAYTDDDCIVDKNWLNNLVQDFCNLQMLLLWVDQFFQCILK